MKNGRELTDADVDRSQAFLGAVLGVDEEGNLPPDHQIGANNPPEPINAPEDQRVAEVLANATEWAKLHPKIEDEEVAVAATNWLNQLDKDWAAIEAKRVAERKPLSEKLKAIQKNTCPGSLELRFADTLSGDRILHTNSKLSGSARPARLKRNGQPQRRNGVPTNSPSRRKPAGRM